MRLPNVLWMPLGASLILICCYACGNAKKSNDTARKTSKTVNWVEGRVCRADETYSAVNGTLQRPTNMIAGRYVQYNTNRSEDGKQYSVWMVNEGKDSVMVYQIPVGNPNKVGYWMYYRQILTSLPNEPIFERVSHFTQLSRDSIKEEYYELPEGVTIDFETLIENPPKALDVVKLDQLNKQVKEETLIYVRKTPLMYDAEEQKIELLVGANKGKFGAKYYTIQPSKIKMGMRIYTKENTFEGSTRAEYLMKNAMLVIK